jgi:hypothetical protein
MRMMLKSIAETEAGNEAVRNGTVAQVVESVMEQLNPEAAYFWTEEGRRTMFVVFDMAEPSQIVPIVEPLFQTGNAEVTLTPCMNLEDLLQGLSQVQADTGAGR